MNQSLELWLLVCFLHANRYMLLENTPDYAGSGPCDIEEMSPRPILSLDDPGIRIEKNLPGKTLLHRLLGQGLSRDRHEEALDGSAIVIDRLRRRHIQHGIAVKG